MVKSMNFEDIYTFFNNPPPHYLNRELAVCYVLSVLLNNESYGTELIELLERDYPTYRLSDTVLYGALKFLEREKSIVGYWKKVTGRGRPRRMYQLCDSAHRQAEELSHYWQSYVNQETQRQAQAM
nr:PadR family transcriptional regulator [Spirulina major]